MGRISHNCVGALATLSLVLLCTSCVEPFQPVLDTDDNQSLLVVESLITDQAGPFTVDLSYTAPVYNTRNVVSFYKPVEGAEVSISDDAANSYMLFETSPGCYETEDKHLKGVPGHSYFLAISTTDGKQYESTAELMLDVPGIDSVYHQEVIKTYFDQELTYEKTWLNILLDTRADGEDIAYFKWEFVETWEMEMPELIEVYHGTDEGNLPPSIEKIEIEEERRHCWVSENSSSILVKSTVDTPGNEIKGMLLQSTGPPDDRLNIKYSILVKQYALNREFYNFFKQIRESNEETGGIYERTPVQITGNIKCCDGSEMALGYFMASAVKTKRIFIFPEEHEIAIGSAYEACGWTTYSNPRDRQVYYPYGTYDDGSILVKSTLKYCVDCRVRGTSIRPDFWE